MAFVIEQCKKRWSPEFHKCTPLCRKGEASHIGKGKVDQLLAVCLSWGSSSENWDKDEDKTAIKEGSSVCSISVTWSYSMMVLPSLPRMLDCPNSWLPLYATSPFSEKQKSNLLVVQIIRCQYWKEILLSYSLLSLHLFKDLHTVWPTN